MHELSWVNPFSKIRITGIEEKLIKIGSPIRHDFFMNIILAALPRAYHGFVAMYNHMTDEWPV